MLAISKQQFLQMSDPNWQERSILDISKPFLDETKNYLELFLALNQLIFVHGSNTRSVLDRQKSLFY